MLCTHTGTSVVCLKDKVSDDPGRSSTKRTRISATGPLGVRCHYFIPCSKSRFVR